jgi:hypothetical protein
LDAFAESNINVSVNNGPEFQWKKRNVSFSDLGPLKDNERRDLNCAVKEYLLIAGYRLTAMTFYEEVCKTVNAPYVFALSLTSFVQFVSEKDDFFLLIDICICVFFLLVVFF